MYSISRESLQYEKCLGSPTSHFFTPARLYLGSPQQDCIGIRIYEAKLKTYPKTNIGRIADSEKNVHKDGT